MQTREEVAPGTRVKITGIEGGENTVIKPYIGRLGVVREASKVHADESGDWYQVLLDGEAETLPFTTGEFVEVLGSGDPHPDKPNFEKHSHEDFIRQTMDENEALRAEVKRLRQALLEIGHKTSDILENVIDKSIVP